MIEFQNFEIKERGFFIVFYYQLNVFFIAFWEMLFSSIRENTTLNFKLRNLMIKTDNKKDFENGLIFKILKFLQ